MEQVNILKEISSLPTEAQKEIVDFIAFLKARYPRQQIITKTKQIKLKDEPFIGMWRERKDMRDSSKWVRNLRYREWENNL